MQRHLHRARFPYPIVILRDGAAALQYLEQAQQPAGAMRPMPFLMLLDLYLPGWSGLEVLARMKQNVHTQHIPVMILTTSDDRQEIEDCYALGCNAYLTKPLDEAQFGEMISRLGGFMAIMAIPTGVA
jgi:CheY-like chemotaxis protein